MGYIRIFLLHCLRAASLENEKNEETLKKVGLYIKIFETKSRILKWLWIKAKPGKVWVLLTCILNKLHSKDILEIEKKSDEIDWENLAISNKNVFLPV